MKEKKYITIPNSILYRFRLEMDDIKGIIRLTANSSKKDTTKITNRNIPITEKVKWDFHNNRTGYSEKPYGKYNFIGSYIDREIEPELYNYWKNFIVSQFYKLRGTAIDK